MLVETFEITVYKGTNIKNGTILISVPTGMSYPSATQIGDALEEYNGDFAQVNKIYIQK